MINFYTGTVPAPEGQTAEVPFFFNDAYLTESRIVIDRPATEDDFAAYPDAYAAFQAAQTPPTPTE